MKNLKYTGYIIYRKGKCDFCGKKTSLLVEYEDEKGNKIHLGQYCASKIPDSFCYVYKDLRYINREIQKDKKMKRQNRKMKRYMFLKGFNKDIDLYLRHSKEYFFNEKDFAKLEKYRKEALEIFGNKKNAEEKLKIKTLSIDVLESFWIYFDVDTKIKYKCFKLLKKLQNYNFFPKNDDILFIRSIALEKFKEIDESQGYYYEILKKFIELTENVVV